MDRKSVMRQVRNAVFICKRKGS